MKCKIIIIALATFVLFLTTCTSNKSDTGTGLSLMDAIEQTAEKIAGDLPKGSRVAIVAFESMNDNLSDYIMEELTGALFDRKIEVADRQNLEYVYKELNLQMSGDISDESAKSIGKFLGADMVITGQLLDLASSYRYRTSAINVEEAIRSSVTRLNVRNDDATRRMIAALARQQTKTKVAKYVVSEKATPQTAGTFIDRGILFASRGDFTMAIADFTEAIKIDSKFTAAYILRGRALYASVSYVISTGDNFSNVGTQSTGGLASKEQIVIYDQAIADFTQALKFDQNNAVIYRERGDIYSDKGDQDRAISDYNQAIKLNPKDTWAYNSRGIAYMIKGDIDKAIIDFKMVSQINPNDKRGEINISSIIVNQRINQEIINHTEAIRLDPNNSQLYYNRGITFYNRKNYDLAIADYTQAIRLAPNNNIIYASRGLAYFDKGDYDKAITDYTQVIRQNPNSTIFYNFRGNAYYMKKDWIKAITDYEEALRIDPKSFDVNAKQNLENARRQIGMK